MQTYFDPAILNDKSDSRNTGIHVSIKNLSEVDIDRVLAQASGYSKTTFRDWITCRQSIPATLIKATPNLLSRIQYLNYRGSKLKVKFPALNEELFYFAGIILGDGHIKGSIRPAGYRRYQVIVQKLRSEFSEVYLPSLIKQVFGFSPKIYFSRRKSEIIRIMINSKIVSRILTNVFGFSYGKKTDCVIDFVKLFPDPLQVHFAAGLLDTDGGRSGKTFAFCNSSQKIVLYISSLFEKYGIRSRFYAQNKGRFKWFLLFVRPSDSQKFLNSFPLKNSRKYGCASGESCTPDLPIASINENGMSRTLSC